MNTERIHPVVSSTERYAPQKQARRHKKKGVAHPIDAVTLDIVDLSDEKPAAAEEYSWLVSRIKNMSDKEVEERMHAYKKRTIDIDDALAEAVMMELL